MEVVERFINARAALNRHGLRNYGRRLLHHFSGYVYREFTAIVFRRDLSQAVNLLKAKVPVHIECYTPAKNRELHEFLDPHIRPDVTEHRLRQGWVPVLGYWGGKLISLSWFSLNPVYLDSIECNLDYGSGAGYIEGSRTSDRAQGLGIAPAIRSLICQFLREKGCREVYVSTGDDNKASQAVARKCGFVAHEIVHFRRILWIRRYRRLQTAR